MKLRILSVLVIIFLAYVLLNYADLKNQLTDLKDHGIVRYVSAYLPGMQETALPAPVPAKTGIDREELEQFLLSELDSQLEHKMQQLS